MKYLPFLDGKYSTAPGLISMANADTTDQTIFQLDYQYHTYLNNKFECCKEAIYKYYREKDLYPGTLIEVRHALNRPGSNIRG